MAHGAERVYLSVAVLPHACGHWAHGTWGLPAIGPPRTTLIQRSTHNGSARVMWHMGQRTWLLMRTQIFHHTTHV